MKRTISAGMAGALLFSVVQLAGAATPLVVPLTAGEAKLKSLTELPVRFNRAGVELLKAGAEVELALPNGSRHLYQYEHSISHGGGFTTWIARSPLTGDNERAVITYGPHGAWGWMKTAYGDYRIHPSGRGYDLIERREPKSFAPKFKGGDAIKMGDDAPSVAPFKGVPTFLPETAQKRFGTKNHLTPVQSDVMFLYTKDLAEKLGVSLMPMLFNLVATVNQAYVDSDVAIVLRMVNATMIDYPNANGSSATLSGMRNSGAHAAFFEPYTWGASSIRNAVGADFVALLRDGPTDTGGIAGLLFNLPPGAPTQTNAYSVNNFCATGCEGIVAHEIGHNMGNHHDPATIAYDSGAGTVDETGVYPYSLGYYSCANGLSCNPYTTAGPDVCAGYATCKTPANQNDFGTIMSYFNPRVMKFSNPLLTTCEPTGAPGAPRVCGGAVNPPSIPATVSDNALSMNNVRTPVSAYRNQTLTDLPGSLQFTNTAYSAVEGGTLTFTVSRSGGSSGSVTVNYAVAAGTASAGADYTTTSGTLTWNPGDTANKTFTVTLATDALVEGVESLTATLSNPTGAPGVYMGYPTSAVGLILEAWPIGPLAGLPTDPTGWSTPASPASSAAWTIVNGNAPVGDPDGRSLQSGTLNFGITNCTEGATPVPCPSAVEITRTFVAGTVAFAYRLSALPFFGFFEFLVDGAVVFSTDGDAANAANGGDTGWRNFSTTIGAGNHTLKWQYRTRLGFDCDGVGVGNPFVYYPGCQDRAWIDQLALPLAAGAQSNPPRLGNISTRMQVLTGNDVMIAGFVIGGSTNKDVAIVATGPSLVPFGIPNALANPTLSLVRSSDQAVLATNDNWQSAANQAALAAAGLAPTNSQEAALLVNLAPGAYTAIVSGVGNTTGVAVAAVYEVGAPDTPLVNISTRGRVLTGNDVMIGGFVITGTGPQQVAIVATGPSLAPFGIANPLANPSLTLVRSSDQAVLATNDDWGSAVNAAAITAAGVAPTNPLESAILTTLPPGAYTAIVSGVGNGTGVAVIGVYRVGP